MNSKFVLGQSYIKQKNFNEFYPKYPEVQIHIKD